MVSLEVPHAEPPDRSHLGEGDWALARDCTGHARMFFNTPDFDLDHAVPGALWRAPSPAMLERLEPDYEAMAAMIMGPIPAFTEVMEVIPALEQRLNETA